MDIWSLIAGLLIGFLLGVGGVVIYMRWKMTRQLNAMQQDMEGMFDATEDLMENMDTMEGLEKEEKEKEE